MSKRYYGYSPGWYVIDTNGNLYGPCRDYNDAQRRTLLLLHKGVTANWVYLREED